VFKKVGFLTFLNILYKVGEKMLFRRKGKLREKENEWLLEYIELMKQRYNNQKQIIQHSVEPSDEVVFRAKLTESLYTFLLREARVRKTTRNRL
jgi:hypothetical protein